MAAGLLSGFAAGRSAVLTDAGLIGSDTVLATTVHPLQVLDETLPETAHDCGLDLIVAGEEVIPCRRTRRPQGLLWEHLDAAKVAAIPALAARAPPRTHEEVLLKTGDVRDAAVDVSPVTCEQMPIEAAEPALVGPHNTHHPSSAAVMA